MRIYVGAVGYGNVEVPHLMSVAALQQEAGLQVRFHEFSALWEMARSQAASQFLKQEQGDVMLLVETDVAFEPADAIALCNQAMTHDVVAAACGETARDVCWVDGPIPEESERGDSLDAPPLHVRWIGSGLFAVHRRVLEKLAARPDMPLIGGSFYPFFYPMFVEIRGQRHAAGDVQAFCERVLEEGFSVCLNPSVRARRVGPSSYSAVDVFVRRPPNAPGEVSAADPAACAPAEREAVAALS